MNRRTIAVPEGTTDMNIYESKEYLTYVTGARVRRERARRRAARRRRFRRCVLMLLLIAVVIGAWHLIPGITDRGYSRHELAEMGIPDDLISLYERNEEARDFVLSYPDIGGDGVVSRDVSEDVVRGEIPLFLQWDKKWGYGQYGGDYFALTGCGPCCLSMVYCGLTGNTDYDPYTMGEWAESEGYYVYGCGSSWSMMSDLAGRLGLNVYDVSRCTPDMIEALEKGRPIIAVMGPGEFTTSGHFIVITGLSGDGRVIVNDPNSPDRSSRTWDIGQVLEQSERMWSYSYQ